MEFLLIKDFHEREPRTIRFNQMQQERLFHIIYHRTELSLWMFFFF